MSKHTDHTLAEIPINVTTVIGTPEETAALLYRLEKKIVVLESILMEHLRTSRQAHLQEVGFLEAALGTELTTKALRDKARSSQALDKEGDL